MAKRRDEKKRYKRYKARKEQLPAGYHAAIDAVERYALRFGPATGETVVRMLEDFLKIYPANPWAAMEQQRLAHTINHAARAEA